MKLTPFLFTLLLLLTTIIAYVISSPSEQPKTLSRKYNFQENKVYQYDLVYESLGKMVESPPTPGPLIKKVDIKLKGSLELSLIDKISEKDKPDIFHLSMIFKPDYLNGLGIKYIKNVEADLKIDTTGNIISLGTLKNDFNTVGYILREVFAIAELPFNNDRITSWEGFEKGFQKNHSVQFTVTSSNDDLYEIEKTYDIDDSKISSGLIQLKFNKSGYLIKAKGSRTLNSYFGPNLLATTETALALNFLGMSDLLSGPEQIHKQEEYFQDSLTGTSTKKKLEKILLDRQLSGSTSESIITSLETENLSESGVRTKIILRLSALLKVKPKEAFKFKEVLRKSDYNGIELNILITALISAGTSEAQQVLRESYIEVESSDTKMANRFLVGLSHTNSPTRESIEFARDLRNNAQSARNRNEADYSLSVMIHSIKDKDPGLSLEVLKYYERSLDDSVKVRDIVKNLSVIGNLGLDDQLDIVKPYTNHQSYQVQQAAFKSLRFLESTEAKNLMITGLFSNNDQVREKSAIALSYRKANSKTIEAYRKRLYSEPVQAVTKQIIINLGKMVPHNTRSLEILKEYSTRCAIIDLCRMAQERIAHY